MKCKQKFHVALILCRLVRWISNYKHGPIRVCIDIFSSDTCNRENKSLFYRLFDTYLGFIWFCKCSKCKKCFVFHSVPFRLLYSPFWCVFKFQSMDFKSTKMEYWWVVHWTSDVMQIEQLLTGAIFTAIDNNNETNSFTNLFIRITNHVLSTNELAA